MAFPVVENLTPSNSSTAVSPIVADMPATVNSGELLVIMGGAFGTGDLTLTAPSGWTVIESQIYGAVNEGVVFIYSKVADGSEGGTTVDIGVASNVTYALHTYRVSGANAIEIGTPVTGFDSSMNPPSLSPSWGSDDNLWIPFVALYDDEHDITSFPTNYTNTLETKSGAGADASTNVGSARRESAVATEDPGPFSISPNGDRYYTNTIAIEPAAASTNFDGAVSFGHTLGLSPSASAAVTGGVTNAQTMGMSDQGGATTLASLEQAVSLALQTSGAISFEGNIIINASYGQGSSATAQTSAELSGAENVTLFHSYAMSTSAQSSAAGATTIELSYGQSATGAVGINNFDASVALGDITYQTSITGTAQTVASVTQSIQYALDSIAAAAVSSNTSIAYINDISASATVITVDVTLADGRTLTIKMQNRTLSIDSENRTLTIDP